MFTGTHETAQTDVCVGWLSVSQGTEVSKDESNVCESNHTISATVEGVKKFYCMKGDESTDEKPTQKYEIGTRCNYT